ncbi:unnamed protein product [Triticum turgidum subsp. durum]|uniref:Uncharacterized protein n=1 Tax=Triticum turgidum subsp. durum TaxID=4567 RepID=A0A9R1PBM8_TRITD|nr:unnamed protein product [Triticum turgidum subsp. durum]
MSFAVDAAAELGVPCPLFWTASACGYMGYYNFRFLMEKGLTPLKGEEKLTNGYLDTPVTNALGMTKHMCLRDFPSFVHTTDQDDILLNFMIHKLGRASRAGAVIDRQHL